MLFSFFISILIHKSNLQFIYNSYHMKQFYLFVFISILFTSVQSFNLVEQTDITLKDDRVKIDFYYESLCPYCKQFILGSLTNAFKTQDFWKICNLNLFPYGNSKRTPDRDTWSFTCQHGTIECILNIMETCAIKQHDLIKQALPFIICLEQDTTNWMTQAKKCASSVGINWDGLMYCTNSDTGTNYEYEMAIATESLQPNHSYVPWIVVNGIHSQSTESAVISNMVRYVCSVYSGSVKISACD